MRTFRVSSAVLLTIAFSASGPIAHAAGLGSTCISPTPVEPRYGSAVVDGSQGEWDLSTDFFSPLYTGGFSTKSVQGSLYLRYDCAANRFYVLALASPGLTMEVDSATAINHFVKQYNETSGTASNCSSETSPLVSSAVGSFAWIGQSGATALGYEASFEPQGTAPFWFDVHAETIDSGAFNTAAPANRIIGVALNCSSPPPPPPSEPKLSIVKTVTSASGTCPGSATMDGMVGEQVKYCYSISNSGDATLFNLSLVDDNGTPGNAADDFPILANGLVNLDSGPSANDLGAGMSVTGQSPLVTLMAVGPLTNVVLASGFAGSGGSGTRLSASASATVRVAAPPASLAIVVLVSLTPDGADPVPLATVPVGTTVYFVYQISNSGGQTVDNIGVSDDTVAVPGTIASLLPGETGTLISLPYFTDGSLTTITDHASATGTAALTGASVASDPGSATVLVTLSRLALAKTLSTDAMTCGSELAQTVTAGTKVFYCYTVSNVGGNSMFNIVVSDDKLGVIASGITLAPGESTQVFSAAVTMSQDTTNVASARGVNAVNFPSESNQASATVKVVHPAFVIAKSSNLASVLVGFPVAYSYLVTNTGDVALANLTVHDDKIGLIGTVALLAPGASATLSASASLTQDTTNIASGTATVSAPGLWADGAAVTSNQSQVTVSVLVPSLSLDLTLSTGSSSGTNITASSPYVDVSYIYVVTNTGNVTLTDISFVDVDGVTHTIASLAPGASVTVTVTEPAGWTSPFPIDATATGHASDGVNSASASDPASSVLNVNINPAIQIAKSVSLDGLCPGASSAATVTAGSSVTYCYLVSNTGNVILSNLAVNDDKLGAIGTIASLAPGASQMLASAAFVTPSAYDPNNPQLVITNVATASGTDQLGGSASASTSASVTVQWADVSLVKSAPASIDASKSSQIVYTLVVTNLGPASAAGVSVKDVLPANLSFVSASSSSGTCAWDGTAVVCLLGNLGAGASATISITTNAQGSVYTVSNTGTVSSTTPESNYSNNASSASTYVAPGATRTIGFYGTHPTFTQKCLDMNGGAISLGWLTIRNESADNQIDATRSRLDGSTYVQGDKDTRLDQAIALAMGVFNANPDKLRDNSARNALEKARMQAGRQVLAAICNSTMLGARLSFDMTAARSVLAGASISAILQLSATADSFNNAGDSLSIGDPGPANSKYAWDDPTDPND